MEFVSNPELTRSVLELSPTSTSVIFLGSYVSVPPPSSIPSISDTRSLVLQGVRNALLTQSRDSSLDSIHLVDRFITDDLANRITGMQFEAFMEAVKTATPGRFFSDQSSWLAAESSKPNHNHVAIAHIAKTLRQRGVNIEIITTNYDLCLEAAFDLICAVDTPNVEDSVVTRHIHVNGHSIEYAKIHGCITSNRSLVTTLDAVAQCREFVAATRVLSAITRADLVLFAGYSASDLDLRPALLRAIQSCPGRCYWSILSESVHLNSLASNPFRKAFFDNIGCKYVTCDLNSHESACNPLMSIANALDGTIPSHATSNGSPAAAHNAPIYEIDEAKRILIELCDKLKVDDALVVPPPSIDSDRTRLLRLLAHGHGARYDEGLRYAHDVCRSLSTPWSRAYCASLGALYEGLKKPLGLKNIYEHMWALYHLFLARVHHIFSTTQRIEDTLLNKAQCLHLWQHVIGKLVVLIYAKVPRPVTVPARLILRFSLVLMLNGLARRDILAFRQLASLERELAARREFMEIQLLAHRPFDENEAQVILDASFQLADYHLLANAYISFGRGACVAKCWDDATKYYMRATQSALLGTDDSLIRKALGELLRLLYFQNEDWYTEESGHLVLKNYSVTRTELAKVLREKIDNNEPVTIDLFRQLVEIYCKSCGCDVSQMNHRFRRSPKHWIIGEI
jgi:SIR2-like domain